MKISRARKKSIALIVTLAFLMTLFPMALPAFAASYSRVGQVVAVEDDTIAALSKVKGVFSVGELSENDVLIIRLPEGFEMAPTSTVGGVYNSSNGIVQFDYATSRTGANKISLTQGGDPYIFDIEVLDENELKLTITGRPSTTSNDDTILLVELNEVYIDKGYDGDIVLKLDAPPGSGFDDGEVVVGRVSDGEVTVEVTDDNTFGSSGGEVTIRVTEDRAGALEVDDESVKFILPKGFEWSKAKSVYNVKVIYGDLDYDGDDSITDVTDGFNFVIDGDELNLVLKDTDANLNNGEQGSGKATCIEFTAWIDVEDETEAVQGDIVAKVRGESNVTPSEITVGTYGDYRLKVTADDPTTVYAGQLEQEIADFTLEEEIDGSLVGGRSLTLTLPEWAKWGRLPDVVKDGSTTILELVSFPGKDGTVAKYTVKNEPASAAELDFKDLEVVLAPDAPEGDLEIEIGGSATEDMTVKVAEVKKPVEVTVESTPTIVIGKAEQKIGKITIKETEAGMLKEGKILALALPRDVEWDEFSVEVTEGDLELGDVDTDINNEYAGDEVLGIEIDQESNDPSTIVITGSVTAYRTVPEGKVEVDVYGSAIVEVSDMDEVIDTDRTETDDGYYYYYNDGGSNNKDAIEIPDLDDLDLVLMDNFEDEGLFEEDNIAEVIVANVGTPAGEGISKAVFTIGSTKYTIDGVEQTMDVAPYVKDGRTYLPVRYVGKALGVSDQNIMWSNKTATFIKGDRVVQVTVGSKTMLVNGSKIEMDVAPEIKNGRTMLPIRWVGVAFGATLNWDNEAKTVTIEP